MSSTDPTPCEHPDCIRMADVALIMLDTDSPSAVTYLCGLHLSIALFAWTMDPEGTARWEVDHLNRT